MDVTNDSLSLSKTGESLILPPQQTVQNTQGYV